MIIGELLVLIPDTDQLVFLFSKSFFQKQIFDMKLYRG